MLYHYLSIKCFVKLCLKEQVIYRQLFRSLKICQILFSGFDFSSLVFKTSTSLHQMKDSVFDLSSLVFKTSISLHQMKASFLMKGGECRNLKFPLHLTFMYHSPSLPICTHSITLNRFFQTKRVFMILGAILSEASMEGTDWLIAWKALFFRAGLVS